MQSDWFEPTTSDPTVIIEPSRPFLQRLNLLLNYSYWRRLSKLTIQGCRSKLGSKIHLDSSSFSLFTTNWRKNWTIYFLNCKLNCSSPGKPARDYGNINSLSILLLFSLIPNQNVQNYYNKLLSKMTYMAFYDVTSD